MSTFALEVWDDECSKCVFYTVRYEDSDHNEFDDFLTRIENKGGALENCLLELLRFIVNGIGNKYGAIDEVMNRHEGRALALPPIKSGKIIEIDHFDKRFPLRVFCYRINEEVLVLFNGGIKSSQTAQNSPELSMKFREAQQFAKSIHKALVEGMVIFENGKLFDFNGDDEIFLYI